MSPDDREALDHCVSQLRELGAEVLAHSVTLLTAHATDIAQRGKADHAAAILFAAQILYVLAHEEPVESLG